jgi:hypothetical protein
VQLTAAYRFKDLAALERTQGRACAAYAADPTNDAPTLRARETKARAVPYTRAERPIRGCVRIGSRVNLPAISAKHPRTALDFPVHLIVRTMQGTRAVQRPATA